MAGTKAVDMFFPPSVPSGTGMLKASAGSSGFAAPFSAQPTGLLKPAVLLVFLITPNPVRTQRMRASGIRATPYCDIPGNAKAIAGLPVRPNFGDYGNPGDYGNLVHSYLSATSGSTLVARRAGIKQATRATTAKRTMTDNSVKGSPGLTP